MQLGFFCSSPTPFHPSLEEELVRAFKQIRPWNLGYVSELASALDIPEALDKIRVPITSNNEGKKIKAYAVIAPCHQTVKDEEEPTTAVAEAIKESVNSGQDDRPNLPDAQQMPYQVTYILSRATNTISIPLLGTNANAQLANQLLTGKPPTGTMFSVQQHFSWDEWKKLKALPDRPIVDDNYKLEKVSQLVLVFHGIGPKLTERLESFNFTYAINSFRILVMYRCINLILLTW